MCAVGLKVSPQQANTPLSDKTDLHESERPAGERLSQQFCWRREARLARRSAGGVALQRCCRTTNQAEGGCGGTAGWIATRRHVWDERQDVKFQHINLWVDPWRHLTAHVWPSFSQKQTVPSCVWVIDLVFCFFKLWRFSLIKYSLYDLRVKALCLKFIFWISDRDLEHLFDL